MFHSPGNYSRANRKPLEPAGSPLTAPTDPRQKPDIERFQSGPFLSQDIEPAFLRAVMSSISEAICVTDLHNRLLMVNESFRKLYGYTDEELIGASIEMILSHRLPAGTLEEVRRTTTQGIWQGELWNRKKDGTEFPIRLSTAPVMDEQGRTQALVGIATDISKEKRTEEEKIQQLGILLKIHEVSMELASLPSSADLYSYLAKTLKDLTTAAGVTASEYRSKQSIMVLRCLEGDPLSSSLIKEILGYNTRDIVLKTDEKAYQEMVSGRIGFYRSLTEVTFGAIPAAVSQLVKTILGIGSFVRLAYSFEGKLYGSSILAFREGHPLPPKLLLETFTSLAAVSLRRYKVEENLRVSNARYRDLFENAPVGIYRISLHGRILAANKMLLEMLQFPSFEQLIIRDLQSGDSQSDYEPQEFQHLIAQHGKIGSRERAWKRWDGTSIILREHTRVEYDEQGNPLYYEGTVEDITEYKQAEAERISLEKQLHQAQRMESIGRLAGGAAHDFNNLLTIINGYSEMMLRKLPPTDSLHHSALEIHKAGKRAAVLIEQLLAYSRNQIMQPQPFILDQIIDNLHAALEQSVSQSVTLLFSLNTSNAMIHADPYQIERVILHLVTNAGDAMPHGGILRIETCESEGSSIPPAFQPKPGNYVVLTVSDTGVGMDEATLQHIFEPFFTTKDVGQGSGLGLSMVQGIIAQSDGFLEVNSQVGRGTTFSIYLPKVR